MIIDVSKWNGVIDWDKAHAAGVETAFIRCGVSTPEKCQTDSKFKVNIEGALKAGVKVGLYYYSFAKTEAGAAQEADYCRKIAKAYKDKLTYPIYIDIEEESCVKYAKTVATSFCQRMKSEGWEAGVYTTTSVFKNQLKGFTGFSKWVAYPSSKAPSGDYDLWQYSWKGSVPGIKGDVDLNTWLKQPEEKPKPKEETTVNIEMPILKQGMKCFEVGTVQRILRDRKYEVKGKVISVDEDFGPTTANCVKQFQQNWGIKVTGVVDELTWSKLLKGK